MTREFESLPANENLRSYPNIRLEPGLHPEDDDISKLRIKITEGDWNTYGWNNAVADRMRDYSPKIMAIDSQRPILADINVGTYDHNLKVDVWTGLPARPIDINPEGTVYVVRGDFDSTIFMGTAGIGYDFEALKEIERAEHQDYTRFGQQYVLEHVARGGVALATYMILKHFLDDNSDDNDEKQEKSQTLTRRVFVRTSSAVLASAWVAPFISEVSIPHAPNETSKDLIQDVITITRTRFNDGGMPNARTAMLFYKLEDTIDLLGMPMDTPGSVIVGNQHTHEGEIIQKDKDYRHHIIRESTEEWLKKVDVIVSRYPSLSAHTEAIRNAILDNITQVDVVRVNDKGGSLDYAAPFRVIDDMVTLVTRFKSPTVEAAIADLRRTQ